MSGRQGEGGTDSAATKSSVFHESQKCSGATEASSNNHYIEEGAILRRREQQVGTTSETA